MIGIVYAVMSLFTFFAGSFVVTMRHYRIYTRTLGNHEVSAQTKREAIARVVARLGLEEERCQTVNAWAVAEVRK